jgi:hypothetical protein
MAAAFEVRGYIILPLKEYMDNYTEYQRWSLRAKILFKEADLARQKGQWKKAQDLLFEARKVNKEFLLNRS